MESGCRGIEAGDKGGDVGGAGDNGREALLLLSDTSLCLWSACLSFKGILKSSLFLSFSSFLS